MNQMMDDLISESIEIDSTVDSNDTYDIESKNILGTKRCVEEILTTDDVTDIDLLTNEGNKKVTRSNRPENWRAIGKHFLRTNSVEGTMNAFPECALTRNGEKCRANTIQVRLIRWRDDYVEEMRTRSTKNVQLGGSEPPYGAEIENLLLGQVKKRIAAGLPMSGERLRRMLIILLEQHNKSHLLVENGGKYCFQAAWESRFCKRHNITLRPTDTTGNKITLNEEDPLDPRKIEDLSDFQAKCEVFRDVIAFFIGMEDEADA